MSDYIGELYMQLELGNKDSGQYFTPYEVSKLSVGMIGHKPNGKGIITLNEVSVGSGGMVIAFAEQLKLQDINYQEKLRVICNDIDHDVVKMAYIQLSLYGIDAIVMQGDTITNKMTEFWYTPMHFINLAREQEENKTKKKLHAMRQAMNLTVGQETKREADIKKTTKLINELEQIDIYDFIK